MKNQNARGPTAPSTPEEIWESVPTAEEIFDRAPDPVVPVEYPETPAFEIADREIMRLLANACLFDPPLTDEEIDRHARRSGLSFREAELELREARV